MSVRSTSGPPYAGPAADSPDPFSPAPDPGFAKPAVRPGEEEAGPLYTSPDADRWIEENVTSKGYVIDWGSRDIIDPNTGEIHGTIPTKFDRMI